jgi:hypothetical protein
MNRLCELNTAQMKQCYPFIQKLSMNSDKEMTKFNAQNRQQVMALEKRNHVFNYKKDGSIVE